MEITVLAQPQLVAAGVVLVGAAQLRHRVVSWAAILLLQAALEATL